MSSRTVKSRRCESPPTPPPPPSKPDPFAQEKAAEFWELAQELVPSCREEPHQVYQHLLRARPEFGRDPETEFCWFEEWSHPSGWEYHVSGTPYNTHFHSIVDECLLRQMFI